MICLRNRKCRNSNRQKTPILLADWERQRQHPFFDNPQMQDGQTSWFDILAISEDASRCSLPNQTMMPRPRQMPIAPAPLLYPIVNNENDVSSHPTGMPKTPGAQDNLRTYPTALQFQNFMSLKERLWLTLFDKYLHLLHRSNMLKIVLRLIAYFQSFWNGFCRVALESLGGCTRNERWCWPWYIETRAIHFKPLRCTISLKIFTKIRAQFTLAYSK